MLTTQFQNLDITSISNGPVGIRPELMITSLNIKTITYCIQDDLHKITLIINHVFMREFNHSAGNFKIIFLSKTSLSTCPASLPSAVLKCMWTKVE